MNRIPPLKLLDLFRLFQRRQRYVKNAYSSELSGLEGFIVLLIHHLPKIGVVELSEMLHLDRSVISRTIKGLVSGSYLEVQDDRYDKRKKIFTLGKNGSTFFTHHLDSNRKFIGHILSFLALDEQLRLIKYLKTIGDTEGAPALPELQDLHPLMLELRRLTISHQIFGSSYLGSTFDTLKWQIFSELAYTSTPISPNDLADTLGLKSNTLSQILDGYEELRLIKRTGIATDRRKVKLALTNKGGLDLQSFEEHASKFFDTSLSRLKEKEKGDFLQLFEMALSGKSLLQSSSEISIIDDDIWCKRIKSEQERIEARAFLITLLVQKGQHRECPETIISSKNIIFALFRSGRMRAICELTHDEKNGVLNEHISATDLLDQGDLSKFLEALTLELSQEKKLRRINLHTRSPLFSGEEGTKFGRITIGFQDIKR